MFTVNADHTDEALEIATDNTVADIIQAALIAVDDDLVSSRARSIVVTHLETAGLWLNACDEAE